MARPGEGRGKGQSAARKCGLGLSMQAPPLPGWCAAPHASRVSWSHPGMNGGSTAGPLSPSLFSNRRCSPVAHFPDGLIGHNHMKQRRTWCL